MVRINKIWMLILALLLLLASFGFALSPLFQVNQIVVQGNNIVTKGDILALAKLGTGGNIFRVPTREIMKSVLLHPVISSVEIRRKLPNGIEILVTERKPVAMIPVLNGFAIVDEQNVFLKRSDTWPLDPLPIISGIELPSNLSLGQRLDSPGLAEGIKIIAALPSDLYPQIGELYAGNRDKLVFYTRDGLEIRFGMADQSLEKFEVITKFLADKSYKPYRAGYYVDLTTGKPVLGKRV